MTTQIKQAFFQMGFSLIAKFVTLVAGFVFFLIITNLMSKAEFGAFSILKALISLLTGMLIFSTTIFILRVSSGKSHMRQIQIFSPILGIVSISSFLVLSVCYLFSDQLAIVLNMSEFSFAMRLSFAITFFAILTRLFGVLIRAKKKIKFSNALLFLEEGGKDTFIVFISLLYFVNINLIFIVRLIITIGSLCIILFYFRKDLLSIVSIGFKFNRKNKDILHKTLVYSAPLAMMPIIKWILTSSDRFMISYFYNPVEVANYSFVYTILVFVAQIIAVIVASLEPYIFAAWNNRNKAEFNNYLNIAFKFGMLLLFPALLGIFAMRDRIVWLLAKNTYLTSVSIIPYLVLFPLFDYIIHVLRLPVFAKNKTKTILFSSITASLLNIALNIILIPRFASVGAAISTTFSYGLLFLYFIIITRHDIKYNWKYLKFGRIVFASVVMLLLVIVISVRSFIGVLITILLGILMYFLILFVTNVLSIKEVFSILKSIKSKNLSSKH